MKYIVTNNILFLLNTITLPDLSVLLIDFQGDSTRSNFCKHKDLDFE